MRKKKDKKLKRTRGLFGIILASLSALVSSSLIVIMVLTACDYINLIPEYVTVNFYGASNELLESKEVLEFNPVTYTGPTPSKEPGPDGPYIFVGWDRNLKNIWHNTNTHAIFVPSSFIDAGGVGDLPDDFDLPDGDVMNITASMPGLTYLRLRSFGDYRGHWKDAPRYKVYSEYTNPMNYAGYISERYSNNLSYDVKIEYLSSFRANPVPVYCTDKLVPTTNDSEYKSNKKEFVGHASLVEPIHFPATLEQLKHAHIDSGLAAEMKTYKKLAKEHYLSIDKHIYNTIKSFCKAYNLKSNSNNLFANISNAVNSEIKFNFKETNKRDKYMDPVESALQVTHAGNSTMFATITTLTLRYLGIPARYCTGYLGLVMPDQVNKPTPIKGVTQLSNWAEAYIDNVGWVTIDPLIDSFLNEAGNGGKPGGVPGAGGKLDLNVKFPETKLIKKTYDGYPFDYNDIVILDDKSKEQLASKNLRFSLKGGDYKHFKDVGTKAYTLKPVLYDITNKDVTKDYTLPFKEINVLLQIDPRPLEIVVSNIDIPYDGMSHSCQYYVNGLAPGHVLTAILNNYTLPGEYEVTVNLSSIIIEDRESDLTTNYVNNYDIKVTPGTLIIYEEEEF